jgi:hypothetical protein
MRRVWRGRQHQEERARNESDLRPLGEEIGENQQRREEGMMVVTMMTMLLIQWIGLLKSSDAQDEECHQDEVD